MFERFGRDLRTAVVLGVEEAKALGVDRVRPEHLLVGLALEGEGPAAELLAEHGFDEPTTRGLIDGLAGADLDGEALAAVGIDVAPPSSSPSAGARWTASDAGRSADTSPSAVRPSRPSPSPCGCTGRHDGAGPGSTAFTCSCLCSTRTIVAYSTC